MMVAAPTSHFTGNASQLILALGAGETGRALLLFLLFFSFITGAGISGFLSTKFTTEELYPRTLQIIGLILFLASLMEGILLGTVMAFVLGFQNALNFQYRGTKVRTTHITGYLTDLGFELGEALGNNQGEYWRIRYYFAGILSFMGGGGLYYIIHSLYHRLPLPLAGLGYLFTARLFRNTVKGSENQSEGKIGFS